MMGQILAFKRKPRTEAERACLKLREAKTLQLRAELMPEASEFIQGFMAGMELEQRWGGVMLNIEERV